MTPGPEAVLTQGVLLELWAFAEAENDIAILYDNKSVALLKGDSNWAVSLENAVGQADFEGNAESETRRYIRPESMEGADYEDYLRILMNTVPERIRILRAMDLIQINMKYLYCDYFRIQDYYVGLRYNFIVNNKEHLFEETYEREEREE